MANQHKDAEGRQEQASVQSGQQGTKKSASGKPRPGEGSRSGIGSSQGQDRGSRDERQGGRPSAGTPDIERSGGSADVERGAGSGDSLVGDPTGAFKERP